MLDAITWTVLLVPTSLAGIPLASIAFRNLPSGGAFLAKPLGLLLVTYIGWLLLFVGPFPNGRGFHLTILFGTAAISIGARYMIPQLRRLKYPTWRRILAAELIFAGVFLAYALYRSRNPEIWGTEKPMDFALLNGIIRSPSFPPQDPWFSGHIINYYYFGYAVASALTWISGVKPAVGFNLALATYLALAFAGAYSLGYDLVGLIRPFASRFAKHGIGAMTAILVMLGGNLYVLHIIRDRNLDDLTFWRGLGWDATRVIRLTIDDRLIDYTINEFPVFSFILGDLHPHVMALPFTLLATSVAIAWFVNWSRARRALRRDLAVAVISGWLLGALYVINSWDFPTFLVLVTIAATVGLLSFNPRRDRRAIIYLIMSLAAASFVAAAAYLPFHLNFEPFASGIGAVQFRSSITQFLTIFGLWVFAAIVFVAHHLAAARRRGIVVLAGGLSIVGLAWFIGNRTAVVILCAILVVAALVTVRRKSSNLGIGAIAVLFFGGFGLAAIPELVFVKDFFGPPNSRMNTVFKLYYQVWPIVGVASGGAIYSIAIEMARLSRVRRILLGAPLATAFAALVITSMSYSVIAGWSKTRHFDQVTLDGLAYSAEIYGADVDAVEWVRNNVASNEIVLEASDMPYSRYGRVSAWTGIPTLVGWVQHEQLWRNMNPRVAERVDAIDAIYSSATISDAFSLLQENRVNYVFVGSLERKKYGPEVIRRFSFLQVAFGTPGRAVIYRVPQPVD